jgi:hypothetical protein
MRFWKAEALWADADIINYVALPRDIGEVVDASLNVLDACGLEPGRLLRVGRHEESHPDLDRLQVDVELAPGVVLQTTHGSTEFLEGLEDDGEDDIEGIAAALQEGIEACLPQLDPLGATLHELRTRARQVVGEWHGDGCAARLVDVQLAPYEHWRGAAEPAVRAMLEGPGDDLAPALHTVEVPSPCDLEHELVELLGELADRSAVRAELTQKGASGYVDQLALNAIAATSADAGEILRRFAEEAIVLLPDTTALTMRDGRVSADGGPVDASVAFVRDTMVVEGRYAPQSLLSAAAGRPASELQPHPHLSDNIRVAHACSRLDGGLPRLEIELEMPLSLFCSVSGRVWPDRAARGERPRDAEPDRRDG